MIKVSDLVRNSLIIASIHSTVSFGMLVYTCVQKNKREIFMWSVSLTLGIISIVHLSILRKKVIGCKV